MRPSAHTHFLEGLIAAPLAAEKSAAIHPLGYFQPN